MKDILDAFGELPNYPGKTKPKNRPDSVPDKHYEDPFIGVPKKVANIDGVLTDLYTIGALAQITGRKTPTVRKWERRGWIPSPTYRTSNPSGGVVNSKKIGYRLYSREQVEVILQALEINGLLGIRNKSWQITSKWVSFITHIQANWPK